MSFAVYVSFHENTCAECGALLEKNALITLNNDRQVVCLSCADLDHLVYLPAGNTALTRRATKYSTLSAVVYQFSRARRRNERQGVLVEGDALQKAEEECLADEDMRAQRREREAQRRGVLDQAYIARFSERIRSLYPNCPRETEKLIAEHACEKYSGRVGRSASAKNLDEQAVKMAVIAHIRHTQTDYDELLAQGYAREDARNEVRDKISAVLESWRGNEEINVNKN